LAKTKKRVSYRWALWVPPLVFIAILFYWPVFRLFSVAAESGMARFSESILDASTFKALWFTIAQALVTTVICVVLGVPGAYLLYRKTFRGASLIRALITVPFVLPVIVVAIGFTAFRNWNTSYGDFGISPVLWIIGAQVFMNYSLVVRAVGAQWLSLSTETEEAAFIDGAGRLRTLWSVSLPQLGSALWSSAALVFLYCAGSFGIILVLGGGLVHTLETDIYTAATSYLDLPRAATLALLQVALTAGAFWLANRMSGTGLSLATAQPADKRGQVDRHDWLAIAISLVTVVPLLVIPMALVVSQAFTRLGQFTLQNFADLGTLGNRDLLDITVAEAALNSVRNSVLSTSAGVLLGVLVAYLLHRMRPGLARKTLDLVFLLPMGVSMVVVGFGYLISFGSDPLPLRSSWLVTPIAQTLVALPLVIRLVYPALQSLGEQLVEAATLDAASAAQIWWRIQVPLIRPALQTAIGYAAVVSIGEFGAASFLAYGDQATLPTVLYRLIARPGAQNYGMAMAMSAILIALTFLVVLVSSETRRQPD
jgi:thiamine transport system permease protein